VMLSEAEVYLVLVASTGSVSRGLVSRGLVSTKPLYLVLNLCGR
jgi:hypothetical protein